MNIENFLSIGIIGVISTFIISYLKEKWGTTGWGTKVVTIILAMVVGFGYTWLVNTPYLETVVGILSASTIAYAFFIKS